MSYVTNSSHSPYNNTGDITFALIQRVQNNPFHPTAVNIGWPDNYDAFPTKTNDQMSSVNVTDEQHNTSEIGTGDGSLFLYHRPRLGTTITITDDTTAVIDSGLTDYNHGIIYFSTNPTGDPITVQYLGDPDKYYGEYLSQLQDSVHEIELRLGAGGAVNQGIMNAEFWLDSTTGNIEARMPNRIHIRAIDRDIEIKSAASDVTGHNITIGNSEDHLFIDVETMTVKRGPNTGSNITVFLTDETGDQIYASGLTHLSPTGLSRNPAFDSTSVITGLEDPARSGGDYDALRVYGDAYFAGNVTVLGSQNTIQAEFTSQVAVINEDFRVQDNAFLGSDNNDVVLVAGDMDVTGAFHQHAVGGTNAQFDRHITLGNVGVVSTIDGLDPSYIASVQHFLRPGGPDWNGDCINFGSIGTLAENYTLTGGYVGSATTTASNADEVVDDQVTSSNFFFTAVGGLGLNYDGRYDDGTWFMKILGGPDAGDLVRITDFDSGTDTWTLSRALGGNYASGLSYKVYNPYFCDADFISTPTASSVQVAASTGDNLIGNISGIVKIRRTNATISGISTDDTHFIYMTTETTGSLEVEPDFASNTKRSPSDQSILVGHVVRSGGVMTDTGVYRPNLKYDSTWRYISADGGTSLPPTTSAEFFHMIGGRYRIQDFKFTVMFAPDNAGQPMVTNRQLVGDPTITGITNISCFIDTTAAGWMRVYISV